VLADLLDRGVESVGDPTQCHTVAIDGRAPKFDGGIVTRPDCVPFSIVANKNTERFRDEGEDVRSKRYAIGGGSWRLTLPPDPGRSCVASVRVSFSR